MISDTLVTPIGDFSLPDPSFDGAAGLATDSLATAPSHLSAAMTSFLIPLFLKRSRQ